MSKDNAGALNEKNDIWPFAGVVARPDDAFRFPRLLQSPYERRLLPY
ncbi:MAG: hypothetical protein OXE95_14525 [Chloroflexi bacterium]|nr:hypothetical protein [Chloroflexota bacterium]